MLCCVLCLDGGQMEKPTFSSKFLRSLPTRGFTCQLVSPDLALYVLLKPFRAFVTVKEPSICAETLTQYAVPLCAGGGGTPGPGCGAVIGATGMLSCSSSIVFAMNIPGAVYSCPLRSEKWSCHRSSSPGAE